MMDGFLYSVAIGQSRIWSLQQQKFSFTQPCGIFLLATWATDLVTRRAHVTKRGTNAQCSAKKFSRSLPLTFLPELNISYSQPSPKFLNIIFSSSNRAKFSCLKLSSAWKYSKTIPKLVLAPIQHYCFEIFSDSSKTCRSRNSILKIWNAFKTLR